MDTMKCNRKLLNIGFLLHILFIIALNSAIDCNAVNEDANGDDICNTEQCKEIAKFIHKNLNESVDPCDDFYQFSCGGWIANNPRPKDKQRWNADSKPKDEVESRLYGILENDTLFQDEKSTVHTALKYYRSCKTANLRRNSMNDQTAPGGYMFFAKLHNDFDSQTNETNDVKELKAILEKVGGFPMIDKNWTANDYNMIEAYVYSDLKLQTNPFFDYTVSNTGIEMLTPKVIAFRYFINDLGLKKRHIIKKIKILNNCTDDEVIEKDLVNVYDLDRNISKLISDAIKEEDGGFTNWIVGSFGSKKDGYTMNEMDESFPKMKWSKMFQKIFRSAGIKLDENVTFTVQHLHYFENIGELLAKFDRRTIANYMAIKIIQDFGSETVYAFKQIEHALLPETLVKRHCATETQKYFNVSLAYHLTNSMLDKQEINQIKQILSSIKASINETFQKIIWMDDEAKSDAQLKLSQTVTYVGYPRELTQPHHIDIHYDRVQPISSDNYVISKSKVNSWYKRHQLRSLLGFNNVLFGLNNVKPFVLDAYYYYYHKRIVIQASLLQKPHFYGKGPLAVNFGAIGYAIGHEVIHGFDTTGFSHGQKVNLRTVWSEIWTGKRQIFNDLAQCFLFQYSSFTEPSTGLKVDGRTTIDENIADNGAIKQAFKAYKSLNGTENDLKLPLQMSKYTPEQLFFISYANTYCGNDSNQFIKEQIEDDGHAPLQARVTVPLRNSDDFAKAFNCPIGSKMNPVSKCALW